MTSVTVAMTAVEAQPVAQSRGRRFRPARALLYAALTTLALAWLVPIGTAVFSSFRYFEADTNVNGVFSMPETLTLDNYRDAWSVGDEPCTFVEFSRGNDLYS